MDTLQYGQAPADTPALHEAFEAGLAAATAALGARHPGIVGGKPRDGEGFRPGWSPIDRDLIIGEFGQLSAADVDDAVSIAAAFAPTWGATDWRERVRITRAAIDLMEQRKAEIIAVSVLETAKNRLEAFGEVEELIGLVRLNCDQVEENEGFVYGLPGDGVSRYQEVLRPYGVWGIIAPFNFPFALAANPISAALLAGNCVVFKPAHQGALTGHADPRDLHAGRGARRGVPHPHGSGRGRRRAHREPPGRRRCHLHRLVRRRHGDLPQPRRRPAARDLRARRQEPDGRERPADLDKAAEGLMHGSFGFGGQKCASTSRAYVQRDVYDEFVELLRAKTDEIVIGDPREQGVYLGPLINDAAGERYEGAVAEARSVGRIVTGGERLTGGIFDRGNYVRPTVVEAPSSSWLWRKEIFVPFVVVEPYDDLGDAIGRANDTEFGLTAGFFSEDEDEIETFLDGIQAGVVYVNRRSSSTTGAWPGLQTFGGWKSSGTSGRSVGGRFYVAQYLREQSRTVIAS